MPATTTQPLYLVVAVAPGTVVVRPCAALDTGASLRLAAILTDLIVGQHNLNVTVDLAKVADFDPAGLDVLSIATATIERRGGSLTLQSPSRALMEALTTAGMARLVAHTNRLRRPKRSTDREAASRSRHPAGRALDLAATITRFSPAPTRQGGR